MIRWETLQVQETLNLDWHTKYIALLATVSSEAHPEGAPTLLLAHRQGFDGAADLVDQLVSPPPPAAAAITLLDHNDIYYRFLLSTGGTVHTKLQLIHPATPAHIAKYTRQERRLIAETPAMYASLVRPWIEGQLGTRLQWVENILAGRSEQDRVLYRDDSPEDGFILLPDSKWDQHSLSSMYLLAIVARRDLTSLRDVRAAHLPLLKRLLAETRRVVCARFPAVRPDQLRFYIHYPPTYFYLHIHIVHVDLETPGCAVGAAHLLEDVIDNVGAIDPEYYCKRTLYYFLGQQHQLAAKLPPTDH